MTSDRPATGVASDGQHLQDQQDNSFVQQQMREQQSKQAVGAGPVIDLSTAPFTGATAGAGLLDAAEGLRPGTSGPSNAVSAMSGVATALTHDATQPEGPAAWAERLGHGATDAAWGILSGPAGVADAITGGNIGGLLKAGSAAVMQGAGLAGQWLGSRFSSGDSAVEPAPIDTAPIEKFGGQMSDGTMARW